jgi:hypothetical protein
LGNRDIVVGIVTRMEAAHLEFDSRERQVFFLFSITYRTSFEIQAVWFEWLFTLRVKW